MPTSSFYSNTQSPSSFFSTVINDSTVSRRQFFEAVASLADANLLLQAIPSDANNNYWREFSSSMFVKITDPLALLAQTTYSWTDDQLINCFAIAKGLEA